MSTGTSDCLTENTGSTEPGPVRLIFPVLLRISLWLRSPRDPTASGPPAPEAGTATRPRLCLPAAVTLPFTPARGRGDPNGSQKIPKAPSGSPSALPGPAAPQRPRTSGVHAAPSRTSHARSPPRPAPSLLLAVAKAAGAPGWCSELPIRQLANRKARCGVERPLGGSVLRASPAGFFCVTSAPRAEASALAPPTVAMVTVARVTAAGPGPTEACRPRAALPPRPCPSPATPCVPHTTQRCHPLVG